MHLGKQAGLIAAAALSVSVLAGGYQAVHADGDCNTAAYGNGCAAPVNVTNTVSGQSVQLQWQMPSYASVPYAQVIERGTSLFQLSLLKGFNSGSVQTSYTDANIPPGTYYYEVCNVYPNLSDDTEDDECAFALPEGVQVKAPSTGGSSSGGSSTGSGSSSSGSNGQPQPAGAPPSSTQSPMCNPDPSQVDPNHVAVYVNAGFLANAPCAIDAIGNYPTAAGAGIPDDSLSSFRVGANVQLVICENPNYGGACSTFTRDVAVMQADGDEDANLRPVAPTHGPGMDNDHMSSMCVQRRGTPPSTPCGSAMAAPGDPAVSDRSQTSITLQFAAGSDGDYASVTCKGDAVDPGCGVPAGIQPSHTLSFDATSDQFTNLRPDRDYSFQACEALTNGSQPAACSAWTNFHTLPPAPTDIQDANVTTNSIEITWTTNVTDAGSPIVYTVARNGTEVSPPGGFKPLHFDVIVASEATQPHGGQGYPASARFIDSFTVDTSQHYVYKVCATDPHAADGPVTACASFTVPLIDLNFSPTSANPVAPYIP